MDVRVDISSVLGLFCDDPPLCWRLAEKNSIYIAVKRSGRVMRSFDDVSFFVALHEQL